MSEYGIKVGVKKLFPNLGDKAHYVVYYRNLQLYLSLGMKLTKIHKILKFKQSDWMKIYIDFNTKKRKMLQIVLKKTFLNRWLIVSMVKQWEIYEKESVLG